MGAIRLPPGGGPLENLLHFGVGDVLEHLEDAHRADLPPHAAVDKGHLPVHPGHPQPLGGVAGDGDGVKLVFL